MPTIVREPNIESNDNWLSVEKKKIWPNFLVVTLNSKTKLRKKETLNYGAETMKCQIPTTFTKAY